MSKDVTKVTYRETGRHSGDFREAPGPAIHSMFESNGNPGLDGCRERRVGGSYREPTSGRRLWSDDFRETISGSRLREADSGELISGRRLLGNGDGEILTEG